MKCEIERAENGFILITHDVDIDEFSGQQIEIEGKTLFEAKKIEDETNRDHIIDLFYELLEHFGEQGGKYDKRRVKIGYEVGRGYEGKEDPAEGVEYDIVEEKGG